MGGKDKAPKGPDWQKLIAQIQPLVDQNQDLFKQAMDFGKEQFSAGQEWVDKLAKYGMDQAGKLNDFTAKYEKTYGAAGTKTIAKAQGIADKYGAANKQEFDRGTKEATTINQALIPGIIGQANLGQDLRDRYEKQGIPFEDKYLGQLRNWDSATRREGRAGEAVGDISMATEAARESELRRLETYGIDPSQTRSAALDSRIQAQNAVAKAAAANQARRSVESEGIQLGANAVEIANNSAKLGGTMSEGAAQQGTAAAAIGAQPGATYLNNMGQLGNYQLGIGQLQQGAGQTSFNMHQAGANIGLQALGAAANQQNTTAQYGSGVYGQGSGILGQSGDMQQGAYSTGGNLNANDIQRVAANNANSFGAQLGGLVGTLAPLAMGPLGGAIGGMMGGGAIAGMGAAAGSAGRFLQPQTTPTQYTPDWNHQYATGGSVDPSQSPSGGAIPDDVHARLSANEYIIDPDTVAWFGKKHFADLQKKAKEGLTGIPADRKRKKAA